jgi:hypothetical protein
VAIFGATSTSRTSGEPGSTPACQHGLTQSGGLSGSRESGNRRVWE